MSRGGDLRRHGVCGRLEPGRQPRAGGIRCLLFPSLGLCYSDGAAGTAQAARPLTLCSERGREQPITPVPPSHHAPPSRQGHDGNARLLSPPKHSVSLRVLGYAIVVTGEARAPERCVILCAVGSSLSNPAPFLARVKSRRVLRLAVSSARAGLSPGRVLTPKRVLRLQPQAGSGRC